MPRLIRSSVAARTIQATSSRPAARRGIHNISLQPRHNSLHQATEPAPQLHGLRLHDHHSYQSTPLTPASSTKPQQANISTSKVQISNISTAIKESKIEREIRESRARQAAIDREMHFRELHGPRRALRNLGFWEIPAATMKKTPAQAIASEAIASSVLRKENERKVVERRNGGSGMNPLWSRARGSESLLCAADLDNIYNL
jgi:hypothetical protein